MTPHAPRPTPHAPRRRGSVLLIVVVSIVALAFLGMAFVQVARVQREIVAEPPDNIDQALAAVVNKIKVTLKEDVISNTGVLFGENDIDGNLYGVEPYDYPTTNFGSPGRDVNGVEGALLTQANFGDNDDAWLSSTTPDFSTSPARWHNVTALEGARYLSNTSTTTPLRRQVRPGVTDADGQPLTSINRWNQNVSLNDSDLVDTDGDGFGDAFWERVPAPDATIEGYEYFMAVRIIDASSLINIMSATAITGDGQDANVTDGHVTGYFPTSLDMSRVAFKRGTGGTNYPTNVFGVAAPGFFALNGLRDLDPNTAGYAGPSTIYPTPFATPALNLSLYNPSTRSQSPAKTFGTGYGLGQLQTWLDGAAVPGQLTNYLDGLYTLHWRGGIDDDSITDQYESELGVNTIGEQMLSDSYDYDSDDAHHNEPVTASGISAQEHFVGTDYNNVVNTTFFSIRHMLTTVNGKAVYSPNYQQMHGTFETLGDLVYEHTGLGNPLSENHQARADNYRDRLARIFALGGGYPTNAPDDQRNAAAAFAAMITEYSDTNRTISANVEGAAGVFWYGLEPLPFLREAYLQVRYEDTDEVPAGGDGDFDTWTAIDDTQAIAVEVGNPFDRPLNFYDGTSNADGPRVRLVVMQGGVQKAFYDLPYRDSIATGDPLESRASIVFISNPNNQTPVAPAGMEPNSSNDMVVDLGLNTSDPNFQIDTLPDGTLTFDIDDTDVTIELQIDVDLTGTTPNYVTYDRLTRVGFALRPSITRTGPNPTPGVASIYERHAQVSVYRDGRNVRYLSNADITGPPRREPPEDGLLVDDPTITYEANNDEFTNDAKIPSLVTHPLDTFQLPSANRPIFSVTELGWIPMFGFTDGDLNGDGLNEDFPTLLTGVDGTGDAGVPANGAFYESERFLRFEPHPSGITATDAIAHTFPTSSLYATTFAEVVLSDFTTLHPGYDGQDNDGDGVIDNDEEQLIFGVQNINTMPRHLAILSASYPSTIADIQSLFDDILVGIDTDPIVNVGMLATRAVTSTSASAPTGQPHFDLYPMPEALEPISNGGQAAVRYPTVFTEEEALKRAQFLTQNFSVRSDIYIAFILVKGYDPNNWDQNGDGISDPIESARAIVVFDRSQLTGNTTDAVRVIGQMFRY